ncbi:LptM family lipoprotein [Gracilibacillus dipsosauri]|uniref:LptM family lipoprotein n=1 Tax=Gracilibacillus dipsosauri TaxID=178340 RepID=UPI002409D4ED
MKKLFSLLLVVMLTIFLAACGDDGETEADTTNDETETEETNEGDQETSDETSEEESEESEEENTESEEASEGTTETEIGGTIENEGGTFTLHARSKEVHEFETGPVKLSVDKIAVASGELKGEMKEFMESDEIDYIQIDLTVENTSEEDITFFAGQATISTDTGEQLESDMFLSEHIEGEMMANTKRSGSLFYVLENSSAEDVESIRLVIDAPIDADWNEIGEKIDEEIELEK